MRRREREGGEQAREERQSRPAEQNVQSNQQRYEGQDHPGSKKDQNEANQKYEKSVVVHIPDKANEQKQESEKNQKISSQSAPGDTKEYNENLKSASASAPAAAS